MSASSVGGGRRASDGDAAAANPRGLGRNRHAALAVVQNALLGGVLYGWTSIDRTLLVASPEEGGAGIDPQQATRIFSVASSASMLSALLLGALLDVAGPRACSVASHALVAAGFALFATLPSASSSSGGSGGSFGRCAVAAVLLAFGGPGIQVSVVHVSNLFRHRQFLVLSAVTGSMSLSFSVFAVFDWLWQQYRNKGVSVDKLFGVYAGIVAASLIASWRVWPDEPFPPQPRSEEIEGSGGGLPSLSAEEQYAEAVTGHHHVLPEHPHETCSIQESRVAGRDDTAPLVEAAKTQDSRTSLHDQPFSRQLSSPPYLVSVVFLLVTCFLANFYIASFSTEVRNFSTGLGKCVVCDPRALILLPFLTSK
jgi:MFS family permease